MMLKNEQQKFCVPKQHQWVKTDVSTKSRSKSTVFFLNVSLTKIVVIIVKELEAATSCVKDQDATTAPARHM